MRDAEAVNLFLARAHDAVPGFHETDAVISTIAQICRDLDGLPLGIELAAAKVRSLSAREIASRLDDRMQFLASWRRLAPARHRTLREAMAWSYELLSREEQLLLESLSVFSGSFTLAAVAQVCVDGDTALALDRLERLVEASLVVARPDPEESRYRLLETVRQFAAERLGASGATDRLRDRHAAYYARLAAAVQGSVQAQGTQVLRRLALDDANLRSGLLHLEASGDAAGALRMAASMWRHWWIRGSLTEGRSRLEALLERVPQPSPERAEALRAASTLALRQGDIDAAIALGEEVLDRSAAYGDAPRARAAVALANALASRGDLERAAGLYGDAAEAFRGGRHDWELANCLMNMVDLELNRNDLDRAARLADESLEVTARVGDLVGMSINRGNLGFAALERDDPESAAGLFRMALESAIAADFGEFSAIMLVGLAAAGAARGLDEQAATALGAADALLERAGASLDSIEKRAHERAVARLAVRLGDQAFRDARAAGRALSIAEAIDLLSAERG
jgi:non-specific serine/threonine protein kinase